METSLDGSSGQVTVRYKDQGGNIGSNGGWDAFSSDHSRRMVLMVVLKWLERIDCTFD